MFKSKNGLKFISILVALFALVFTACSDDGSVRSLASQGGTEEETAYVLNGQIGNVFPKLLKVGDENGASLSGEAPFAREGSFVAVIELDSMDLSRTGRIFEDTIMSNNGTFSFADVSLRSPYVMIENQERFDSLSCPTCYRAVDWDSVFATSDNVIYMRVVRAIVDLRVVDQISVNALTDIKAPLWLKYVAEGMEISAASEKAEREVLESFGVYKPLGSFEKMVDENSELAYVKRLACDLKWGYGALDYVDDFYRTMLFIPQNLISKRGADTERLYRNSEKMNDYRVGYLAQKAGYGQCTELRENEMRYIYDVYDDSVAVVCRSGKWTLGFKKIDYTSGMMTDNHDGKTYKTVTYNIDGVSQTWMAENLSFADTSLTADSALKANLPGQSLCKYYDSKCEVYGRYYTWIGAMNIGEKDFRIYSVESNGDTTFLKQECYDVVVNECPEDDYDCKNEQYRTQQRCDTLYVWSRRDNNAELAEMLCYKENTMECGADQNCMEKAEAYCDSMYGNRSDEYPDWSYGFIEYMSGKNKDDYQGVCPDGWRVPTLDDWKSLLQMMGRQYGVDPDSAAIVLYDEVATGFGMKKSVDEVYISLEGDEWVDAGWISVEGEWWFGFTVADAPYYTIVFNKHKGGLSLNSVETFYSKESGFNSAVDPYYSAPLRCIKK